jgi:Ni,Fe-hydrogenase maturation factor
LHIAASDVMILNTSFRGLLNQLLTLNATLQHEIQTFSKQVADLKQARDDGKCACATNNPLVKFNATTATQTKLLASDGTAGDGFGYAVAATDGMVAVGAYGAGDFTGAVYVFEKNSTGQYEQVSKLVASDGTGGDLFGSALVATDGMVVVGAYQKGSWTGSVYVFEKNSTGQYDQVSKLVASDGARGDRFGWAVAATDGMVVVGAYLDGVGSGYVFEKNSTGQYEQVSKLMASDGAGGDRFGFALAATDGMVVVGAYQKGSSTGSVYVFEKNSTGQYEQVSKLVASDGTVNDSFGWAVAATDDMVAVGAKGDDDKGVASGSVYVFEKNSNGQYGQVGKLVASDGASSDNFGYAVAATDGMVVVGARYDDDKGSSSGSVYVFEKNITGQYEQASKLVASDGAASDWFGYAVAATDGMVVVGAYFDDDKGKDSGSVYAFY